MNDTFRYNGKKILIISKRIHSTKGRVWDVEIIRGDSLPSVFIYGRPARDLGHILTLDHTFS